MNACPTKPILSFARRRAGLCLSLALLLGLLTGCEDPPPPPPPPPPPDSNGSYGQGEPEVLRDTAFIVIEKRQAGGRLVEDPGNVSAFDGRPRMRREPLELMIIVRGNQTGQERAFLLPQADFNVVREGHRLLESTLARWESVGTDHIPPPPPPPSADGPNSMRSRAGGADGGIVY